MFQNRFSRPNIRADLDRIQKMHVLVIGAGIIGVATAYELAGDGHDVTVIDRQSGPCRETSFANGGQISASHADPWASAQNLRKIIGWLWHKDSPIRLSPGMDRAALGWCLRFLRNCTTVRNRTNTGRMLGLAMYSRSRLGRLNRDLSIGYRRRTNGILHIYRDKGALALARQQAIIVQDLGCIRREVAIDECLAIEPALVPVKDTLAGAMYCPDDESGDARMFGVELAGECKRLGVRFLFDTFVHGLENDGPVVRGVITDPGLLKADSIVLAAGSYSPLIVQSLGIRLPVYPVKGYSVTFHMNHMKPGQNKPTVSLIDDEHKIVYSRLGEDLRAAGMGELSGYDLGIDPVRARQLAKQACSLFPAIQFDDRLQFWSGLRPQTPDSVPVLGKCGFENLYLNTGHGTLGWTMAAGSARITADLVAGQSPEIDISGLTIDRF